MSESNRYSGITTNDLRTASKVLHAIGMQMVEIESEWPWWRRLIQKPWSQNMFIIGQKVSEMAEMVERKS